MLLSSANSRAVADLVHGQFRVLRWWNSIHGCAPRDPLPPMPDIQATCCPRPWQPPDFVQPGQSSQVTDTMVIWAYRDPPRKWISAVALHLPRSRILRRTAPSARSPEVATTSARASNSGLVVVNATRYLGRALWRRWSGYHRRSRVETKMHCVKLSGQSFMARDFDRQVAVLLRRSRCRI